MNKRRFKLIDILLLVLTILVSLGYLLLNKPTANIHIISTSLDPIIPLVSVFAIPYLLFLPIFWIVVLCAFFKQKMFKELGLTIIVVNLVSFLFFFFYQTEIIRPQITGSGLSASLIRFIYRHDAPYNGFPSLHTSLSTIMAFYFIFVKSKWSIFFVILSLLIILSTLFTKQHYLLDVVGGLILATVTSVLFFKESKKF